VISTGQLNNTKYIILPVKEDGLRQLSRTVLNSACWRSNDITAGTLVGSENMIFDTRTPNCSPPSDDSDELDT